VVVAEVREVGSRSPRWEMRSEDLERNLVRQGAARRMAARRAGRGWMGE
jgi:hypothetical protein